MSSTEHERPCTERVGPHWQSRRDDLETLLKLYQEDPEAYDEGCGNLNDYGLSFDYVEPYTFDDQPEGYFRYQISWGGPSDELRFFVNLDGTYHRADYWFMDWFDGASLNVTADEVVNELWDWLEPAVSFQLCKGGLER